MIDWEKGLLSIPIFLLSLTIHEFAHGYAAYRLGDKTAFHAGRLTFNPLKHLDPFGALVFVMSNFSFGWAKPVPVRFQYMRDAKQGMLITALAGPVSNLLQAAVFGLIIRVGNIPLYILVSDNTEFATIIGKFVWYGVIVNCGLAFFNMFPVAPLDGSKVLYGLLPRGQEQLAINMERYGPFILIMLIGLEFLSNRPIIWAIIGPLVKIAVLIFAGQALW